MSNAAAEGAEAPANHPSVSVIVPAYNAASGLAAAITRVLVQSFQDYEVVLVDDGSTDATAEIAARFAEQHARVRFFALPENAGVARAREHAVARSRGEFLWFIDADDAPDPRALELLVKAARRENADVVVCGAQFVDEAGGTRPLPAPHLAAPVSGKAAFRMLLKGEISGHLWNKLFRRDLAGHIQFTPARVHSDLAMTAQLLARATRVIAIPDVLYSYLLRGGSIIHSGSSRGASLALIDGAVRSAALGLDARITDSSEYRYFRLRFILLSGLKDAVLGPYEPAARTARVAALRRELVWSSLLLPVGARDWKRFAFALTAKLSLPLYRRLLGLADTRARTPRGHPLG